MEIFSLPEVLFSTSTFCHPLIDANFILAIIIPGLEVDGYTTIRSPSCCRTNCSEKAGQADLLDAPH